MTLKKLLYDRLYVLPGDINECNNGGSDVSLHLPPLMYYANKCDHVTSVGIRNGYTDCALMYGLGNEPGKKMVSYDYAHSDFITDMQSVCQREGYNWNFIRFDVNNDDWQIEETDFLFLDGPHYYNSVIRQLRQLPKVKRYVGTHDWVSCGHLDHETNSEGLQRAFTDLIAKGDWTPVFSTFVNNGLIILERSEFVKNAEVPLCIWDTDRFRIIGKTPTEYSMDIPI